MHVFWVKLWGETAYREVEADDARMAVESVAGRKVREVGRRGKLVATVRQKAGVSEVPVPYYADEDERTPSPHGAEQHAR